MAVHDPIARAAAPWLAALTSLAGAVIVAANVLTAGAPAPVAWGLGLAVAIQVVAAVGAAIRPSHRRLLAAAVIAFAVAALWRTGQTVGLPGPDGATWRLEAAAFPDLYPGLIDVAAAAIFAACAVRRWPGVPRGLGWLLAVLILLAAVAVAVIRIGGSRVAEILMAVLVLDGGPVKSLLWIALPVVVAVLAMGAAGAAAPRARAVSGLGWKGGVALAPALFLLAFFAWGGLVAARQSHWFSSGAPLSIAPGGSATLAYCWPGGRPLAMDLAEPAASAARPAPAVIYLHGGETLRGSRKLDDGSPDGPWFARLRSQLLAQGFAVAAIDYRLGPFNPVPDEFKDARCAVDFLRAHAGPLGLDPHRIGAYGPSQGGYLAAMLGLTGQVQAVVDMWGPADLGDFSGSPGWVAAISGVPAHPTPAQLAQLQAASPLYNVAPGAPPFLIIHGDDDVFLAPHHSRDLAARLSAAGADVTLIPVHGDGHGLAAVSPGKREDPAPVVLIDDIAAFFTRTLGPKP